MHKFKAVIWLLLLSSYIPVTFQDLQSTSVRASLGALQDPELKDLAESLNGTVLKSKAKSTTKKYLYAIEHWRKWAKSKDEINEFPIVDFQFAQYLQACWHKYRLKICSGGSSECSVVGATSSRSAKDWPKPTHQDDTGRYEAPVGKS